MDGGTLIRSADSGNFSPTYWVAVILDRSSLHSFSLALISGCPLAPQPCLHPPTRITCMIPNAARRNAARPVPAPIR
jgi:hypothetical protein